MFRGRIAAFAVAAGVVVCGVPAGAQAQAPNILNDGGQFGADAQ